MQNEESMTFHVPMKVAQVSIVDLEICQKLCKRVSYFVNLSLFQSNNF